MKNLLYNMTKIQADVYDLFDENGEITPEIELELDKFEANVNGRALTIKMSITRMKDKALLAKEKKEHFAIIQKNCESAVKAGIAYLTKSMIKLGIDIIEEGTESIKLRKTPEAVHVIDEDQIPDQYKTYIVKLNSIQWKLLKGALEFDELEVPKPTKSIDKAGIKAEYKLNKLGVSGTEIKSGMTVTLKG